MNLHNAHRKTRCIGGTEQEKKKREREREIKLYYYRSELDGSVKPSTVIDGCEA